MDRDVWILGTSMTKFERYPDKDLIDLGAEAALAALADGGVTIQDMDVLGAGNLAEAASGVGQRLQKQIGQTGIPVYNVANACATGATAVRCAYLAIKAGEAEMGLAVGLEQMGKRGLLGASARSDRKVFEPSGRYGSVMSVEGLLGTTLMPGVFAQAGMEYAGENDGVGFEQFAKVAEKNHAHSTLNPLAQYQKAVLARRGDERRDDGVPEHAADVLPDRRRRGRARARERGEAADALGRAARARGEDQRVGDDVATRGPSRDQVQPDVNTLTRDAAAKAYEISGVDPQDLDLVELHDCFATAELIHYDNLRLCAPGEAGKFIDERGPWRDGEDPRQRQRRPDLEGPPARRDRRREPLRGGDAPARRGRRPPDRGRDGRAHPRHRARLRLRGPRAREGDRLAASLGRQPRIRRLNVR